MRCQECGKDQIFDIQTPNCFYCGAEAAIEGKVCCLCQEPISGEQPLCRQCGLDLQRFAPIDLQNEESAPASHIYLSDDDSEADVMPELESSPEIASAIEPDEEPPGESQIEISDISYIEPEVLQPVEPDLDEPAVIEQQPEPQSTTLPQLEPIEPTAPHLEVTAADTTLRMEESEPGLLEPQAPAANQTESDIGELESDLAPIPRPPASPLVPRVRKSGLSQFFSGIAKLFKWVSLLLIAVIGGGVLTALAARALYPGWFEDKSIMARQYWEHYFQPVDVNQEIETNRQSFEFREEQTVSTAELLSFLQVHRQLDGEKSKFQTLRQLQGISGSERNYLARKLLAELNSINMSWDRFHQVQSLVFDIYLPATRIRQKMADSETDNPEIAALRSLLKDGPEKTAADMALEQKEDLGRMAELIRALDEVEAQQQQSIQGLESKFDEIARPWVLGHIAGSFADLNTGNISDAGPAQEMVEQEKSAPTTPSIEPLIDREKIDKDGDGTKD